MADKSRGQTTNRSDDGYEYEADCVERIINESKGWKSTNHEDSRGRPIKSRDDVKRGPDGGIDLVTRIRTEDKGSGTRLANRLYGLFGKDK